MQLRPKYPPYDTARGACFITGDYDDSEGIVDLDMWLEDLPPRGRLCVSPKAVRMMAATLGIELPESNVAEANRQLIEENRRLRTRLTRIEKAVTDAMVSLDKFDAYDEVPA